MAKRISSFDRFERILFFLLILCLSGLVLAAVLYQLFAPSLIESMYHGESFGFLNRLIQYQEKYPVEHYLQLGRILFFHILKVGTILFVLLWGWCWLLYRLLLTNKRIYLLWVIALAVFTHHSVFLLNPSWGIYYAHGFFRASLVYQILQGHVPPLDPLFAGGPVRSPWAFPWLTSWVVRIFQITPYRAFHLINSVCLGLGLWLVYRISGLLTRDRKARLFSIFTALFAITPLPQGMIVWIQQQFHSGLTEWRATPILSKYLHAAGDPTGLVFVLLALLASVKLLSTKSQVTYSLLLGGALLGCGFSFPAFFPGLVCGIAGAGLAATCPAAEQTAHSWRRYLLILLLLAASCVILFPYVSQSSSGPRTGIRLFDPVILGRNLINALVPLLPILLLCVWQRKEWVCLDRKTVLFLMSFSAINLLAYLCISILETVEYKFLILSVISFGMAAGTVFAAIRKRHLYLCCLLFLAFLAPSVLKIYSSIRRYHDNPFTNILKNSPGVRVDGIYVEPLDAEEREMYQWIHRHTPEEAVFVDTSWDLPVMGPRRLWMALDFPDGTTPTGYSVSMEGLKRRNAYPEDLFSMRKTVLENLYGLKREIPENCLAEQIRQEDLWAVVRTDSLKNLGGSFRAGSLPLVFQSSGLRFRIFHADLSTPTDPAAESLPDTP